MQKALVSQSTSFRILLYVRLYSYLKDQAHTVGKFQHDLNNMILSIRLPVFTTAKFFASMKPPQTKDF